MSGFQIDPVALRGLLPLLDRLREDANTAVNYLEANTTLEYGEGLINKIKGNHENVIWQVRFFLEDVAKYTGARTSNAVESAISYYESTDIASATKLDSTYRGATVDRSQFSIYYRASYAGMTFTDRAEPQSNYQAITDYDADQDFQFAPQLWDISSPTSMVRDTVWGATWLGARLGICDRPYDPYESLVKPLSGDWAGVRGCADVLHNISNALTDMSVNVHFGALGADLMWSGQAADAAVAHLLRSAAKLAEAGHPLDSLAGQYKTTSTAMFEIGKVIGSLISDIVDAALIFAAEASLAAATSETIVGGVIFGAAALYEGYKMWDLIKEALDLVGRADSLTSALNSAAGDFGLVATTGAMPVLAPPPDLPA